MALAEVRTHRISTSRTTHHVREQGTGSPLVLLHGWPQSGYCWEGVAPILAKTFRVICPDLRGLGDSARTGAPEDFQKKELALDILALLDAMQITSFGLAGHDWGGVVAQEMAISAPERVTRLAILNVPLINNPIGNAKGEAIHATQRHFFQWYKYFQMVPNLAEAMIPGNEEPWLRTFLRKSDGDAFPETMIQEYVRCYQIPGTATSGANFYRAMPLDGRRQKTLADHKFPMPGLLLFGKHDPVIVPEYLIECENAFETPPDIKWVEAGHFVMEEKPDEVAQSLKAFFGLSPQ